MSNRQYYDGDDEQDEAQARIDRIRGGAGGSSQPAPQEEGLDEYQSPSASRARTRSRSLSGGSTSRGSAPAAGSGRSTGRTQQAIIVIGAVVGLGLLLVIAIFAFSRMGGGGGLGTLFTPPTETPTPTPTSTPTPTPTETPTPTIQAPDLQLPPLTCIFQSGQGCSDYCADAANTSECDAAFDFIEAQGADPDFWLTCLSPGSGANTGNPQTCLEDAWRERNAP